MGFHASVSGSSTAVLLEGQSGDLVLGRASGVNKFLRRRDRSGLRSFIPRSRRQPDPYGTSDITGVAAGSDCPAAGQAEM